MVYTFSVVRQPVYVSLPQNALRMSFLGRLVLNIRISK
nr:MAG TPA: hypothetical protein [Bacteriophage sp.]